LGKLHQAPGGRGLANTRGSAQKHYPHRPKATWQQRPRPSIKRRRGRRRAALPRPAGAVDQRHRVQREGTETVPGVPDVPEPVLSCGNATRIRGHGPGTGVPGVPALSNSPSRGPR
jgi:hypothetical protein